MQKICKHALFAFCFSLISVDSTPASATNQPLTFAFDLGGVLLETNEQTFAQELGEADLATYHQLTGKGRTHLWYLLYQVLKRMGYENETTSGASDPSGNRTPGLACAWMCGTRSCRELRHLICPEIEQHPEWFSSDLEQTLLHRFVNLIFNPKRFARIQQLQPGARSIIRWCKKRGHRVVVLSNWCRASFDYMLQQHRNFFDLFDEIIISGRIRMMKPDPRIFHHLTRYVPVTSCIFIDNQRENIDAAQKLGIHTIFCPTYNELPDLATVENELKKLEASLTQNTVMKTATA